MRKLLLLLLLLSTQTFDLRKNLSAYARAHMRQPAKPLHFARTTRHTNLVHVVYAPSPPPPPPAPPPWPRLDRRSLAWRLPGALVNRHKKSPPAFLSTGGSNSNSSRSCACCTSACGTSSARATFVVDVWQRQQLHTRAQYGYPTDRVDRANHFYAVRHERRITRWVSADNFFCRKVFVNASREVVWSAVKVWLLVCKWAAESTFVVILLKHRA